MKIRTGFVSNSSSTSFTFCFKGDSEKELFEGIRKYANHFKLSWDGSYGKTEWICSCNAEDVIESIKDVVNVSPKYDWLTFKIITVDEAIKGVERDRDWYAKNIEEEKKKNNRRCTINGLTPWDWEQQFFDEAEEHLKALKVAKDNGLNSVVVLGFGDNDGHISSGDVGYAMDYEGRNIVINENDFVVFTVQDR